VAGHSRQFTPGGLPDNCIISYAPLAYIMHSIERQFGACHLDSLYPTEGGQ